MSSSFRNFWVILFSAPILFKRYQIDLHHALSKAMTTFEDQKEKFAFALQNTCSVIIGKPQGKCLSQSPASETSPYGLLKTELHR